MNLLEIIELYNDRNLITHEYNICAGHITYRFIVNDFISEWICITDEEYHLMTYAHKVNNLSLTIYKRQWNWSNINRKSIEQAKRIISDALAHGFSFKVVDHAIYEREVYPVQCSQFVNI